MFSFETMSPLFDYVMGRGTPGAKRGDRCANRCFIFVIKIFSNFKKSQNRELKIDSIS